MAIHKRSKAPVHRGRRSTPRPPVVFNMTSTSMSLSLIIKNVMCSLVLAMESIRSVPVPPVPRVTHIKRERSSIDRIHELLGDYYFKRSYRMTFSQFRDLVAILKPYSNVRRKMGKNGEIPFSLKVSCFIRFAAGGATADIGLSHGLGNTTVTTCVWQVMSAINKCPSLDISFPTSHIQQNKIAEDFRKKSKAGFDCCVGCVDGMLVWTEQPRTKDCEACEVGPRKFHCGRKSKFGFNMQAICDSRGVFLEVFIKHPASASDYIAFITDQFYGKLHTAGFIAEGLVLFGDNAYVSNEFMATPYKGVFGAGIFDSYNFFHSQLRINIECAFGMLTRRWGILRKPLPAVMGIKKQVLLVYSLCKLHNYIIKAQYSARDYNAVLPLVARDELNILNEGGIQNVVRVGDNEEGIETPEELLNGGEHFDDNNGRRPRAKKDYARQRMRKHIQDTGFTRITAKTT
jgi:hypothetical protein